MKPKHFLITLLIFVFVFTNLIPSQTAQAATYTVTNINDSGAGSLRQAITEANANSGADTIQFNIDAATLCGGGVCTIQPLTPLPALTDGGDTIDGYTQPGASPATAGSPAVILIEIDGSLLPAAHVASINAPAAGGEDILAITSAHNTIRGMAINRATRYGISLWAGADYNTISGNYIGLGADGATDFGNTLDGVYINGGANHNQIGGDTPAMRNVISGNARGVQIRDADTVFNTVSGNYIGVNANGAAAIGNDAEGVLIANQASHNTIGGDTAGERNIISGNGSDGVALSGSGTASNTVAGNYIGLDADGAAALQNGGAGVRIETGAQYNLVGGDAAGERNVISGNRWDGVSIGGSGTMSNTVAGNYIGVDPDGTAAIGNYAGFYIYDEAQRNTIGPDNLISGNTQSGIEIAGSGTMSNTVAGNAIGVDAGGAAALGNEQSGVYIRHGAQRNIIGAESGDDETSRNIISGNAKNGVYISDAGTNVNTVAGNYIGVDAGGAAAVGNAESGVFIDDGAQGNTIEGNTISANDYGVWIQDENTSNTFVIGNDIGTAANGVDDLGNMHDGVHFSVGAQINLALGNHIAYNGGDGVGVDTPTAFEDFIWGNSIHDNGGLGIHLTNGANHGILPPNINSAALDSGKVVVSGAACSGCRVDLYASPDGDGEGQVHLGIGAAGPAGDFDIEVSDLPYLYLTATASNSDDGTSEFSAVLAATLPILDTSAKSADRDEVRPGEILTYTLTLTNSGSAVAAAATLTDTLPAEVTWADEYRASAGVLAWDAANKRLLWSGSVGPDAPVVITYQVAVSDTLTAGAVFSNTAALSGGLSPVEIGPATVTVLERMMRIYLPLVLNNE